MQGAWIPAAARLAIGTRLALGLMIVTAVAAAAGCLSDAIKQNQQQLEQQNAELEQLKQQVADLKAAQQPSYPTSPPPPGSCDRAVMQEATRRGGERLAASEFTKALGYYQDAVTACPTNAQASLNVARAYEALGDRGRAADYYRRAVQAAPTDHDANPAIAEQAQQALARLAAK